MKKILLTSLCFLLSFSVAAVDPQDVDQMVGQFEASGIIPASEAKMVREEIRKMSPQQWKEIESIAQQYQQQINSPNVQNNLGSAVQHVNTDSDQFRQISSDLEKVMKERQDLLD